MAQLSICDINGGAALCEWLGEVPGFYDSELLDLEIRQGQPSRLKASAFRLGPGRDGEGFFIVSKHVIVTFEFISLCEVELYEFEERGYLDGVKFEDDGSGITMNFESSAGVHGRIKAKEISIGFEPKLPHGG